MSKKLNAKTSHTIPDSGLLSNSRSWRDFMDQDTLSVFCGREEWRERLINTMLSWSDKSTSLEVQQFCMEYKIPYGTLKEWEYKYPDIAHGFKEMKRNIACHRKVGAYTKKLDGNHVFKDLHRYDPEWHDVNKYHSDMKKDEEKQPHTFVIDARKPTVITKEQMIGMRENDL